MPRRGPKVRAARKWPRMRKSATSRALRLISISITKSPRNWFTSEKSFDCLMRFFSLFLLAFALTASTAAQSTNQNFPTPITANEIEGTIKARDVGDSRVTSYYYQFDAGQGDLFINIVTRNLTADIDV